MNKPNILFITTDQQRYDSIAALGYPWMKTPRLDRLAAEGASLTHCYAAAPSCVPSRYSLFNAKYPHTGNVTSNGGKWGNSWVGSLNKAGWCCVNVGKMHTIPMDAAAGFHQRFVIENKDRADVSEPRVKFWDEWDKFLLNNRQEKPCRHTFIHHPEYETALGAYAWPLEKKYHSDEFTGNLAAAYIDQYTGDAPLFLEVGFPGPHPPYDPPQEYLDMYADTDIPVPNVTDDEVARQPACHAIYRKEMCVGNHDAVKWHVRPSATALLRLRRHYAANMTLIDQKIGEILDALERRGMLENTIIIFTSDHGDCLGDHGLVQKWNMYEESVRVPTLIHAPGRVAAGTLHHGLTQQMDLARWLFDELNLPVPADWEAEPIKLGAESSREFVFAEQGRDGVWKGADYQIMVRSVTHKLVCYPGKEYGELYDLVTDPSELRNEWDSPRHADIRARLMEEARKFIPGVRLSKS